MKSIKQNCVWAVDTIIVAKHSNWKCTKKGISITYDLGLLGNRDVTVPFAELRNEFFLEPVGSMYV